jgi:hypothetical protein
MCVYRFCISDAELGLRIEAVWGTVRDRYYKETVGLCNTGCLNAEIFCMLCNHTAAVSCHLCPAMLARIAACARVTTVSLEPLCRSSCSWVSTHPTATRTDAQCW